MEQDKLPRVARLFGLLFINKFQNHTFYKEINGSPDVQTTVIDKIKEELKKKKRANLSVSGLNLLNIKQDANFRDYNVLS